MITQLLSFLSIGALATLLQYALTAGLVLAGALSLVPASTVGFLISAVFNYWANSQLTFAAQSHEVRNRAQQMRFVAMAGLGLSLNAVLLWLASTAGMHPVFAQIAATSGVLACNFTLSRLWVFRKT